MDCDIPDRVVGSLDKAADIIFTDKSCRYVKLHKAVEAALKAEKKETQWPLVMSIHLTMLDWDNFQVTKVENPIIK